MNGLVFNDIITDNYEYLTKQIITYIGNKRALLGHILKHLEKVKKLLGKDKLALADLFSGSGIVARIFKGHAQFLLVNDIEDYSRVINNCFLTNRSEVDYNSLVDIVKYMNEIVDKVDFPQGFIEELYAPQDEKNIKPNDRVFYTKKNARRIDNYRRLIDLVSEETRDLFLGPLLSEASIHVNTSGVFKSFYKDRHKKVGKFGGTKGDALKRIKGDIVLEPPVLSDFEVEYKVCQQDANELVGSIRDFDLVYLDPPYNEHPYGSNYFMLNLIVNYQRPSNISKVVGIPKDWRRSDYNKKHKAFGVFKNLVESLDSKFVLISYNDEGFINLKEMLGFLSSLGKIYVDKISYSVFKASRNIHKRSKRTHEFLILLQK